MKSVIRLQSQLLNRRSYKPKRVLRIKPARLNFTFRPALGFGVKPILISESKPSNNGSG